jgi:inhibitor of cysteine peptidase
MVQREIKKKTTVYGAVAILSAIVLISSIYVFGAAPLIYPSSQTPPAAGMKTFSSMDELTSFVSDNSIRSWMYGPGPLDTKFFGSPMPIPEPVPETQTTGLLAPNQVNAGGDQYSTTNIQVAGVDEADTVKTDGQYIYTASTPQNTGFYSYGVYSQSNSTVYIVNANPQDPNVVSKIPLGNGTEAAGLFLSSDSSKLVVLASKYQTYSDREVLAASKSMMLSPYHADVYTYMNVYDVSNKADPVLTENLTVSGSYFDSRMIGDDVYAVVSEPATVYNGNIRLPTVIDDNQKSSISPSSIYYSDINASNFCTFTSFYALDLSNTKAQPTNLTVMMGSASTMYVSPTNIYVTYPMSTSNGYYSSIYRIAIDGLDLTFQAKATVPGLVLNQYSMDEYNGNLRVATNWQGAAKTAVNTEVGSEMNNVYVLNQNLSIVGKLEGLAPGEQIYSARFMGDRAYIVTYKQTDPFFVVDLSNPAAPKLAGELKIPGYSSYLHPYDENHIIGLGIENNTVKLSLFDVTNPNKPIETAHYNINGYYASSEALNDPKAFLFDLQRQLLVIPVDITYYGNLNQSSQLNPSSAYKFIPAYIADIEHWQGACVFNLNLQSGFNLKGTVTHLSNPDNTGYFNDTTYYNSQNNLVTRSFYIGNTLYTISNSEVKLNNLTDLAQTGEVSLK